jgi:SAM-dependent methyltransferase
MDVVKNYYNDHILFEDRRLEENVFELPLTLKYIERYVYPGDKILDISCGTGRYARSLLEKGYLLGLNDLSEKNMELTLERTDKHPNIILSTVSDALDSSIWNAEEWDAILMLGPLYHMIQKRKRLELLKKAQSSVKTNGWVYSAFMSRTAALLYGLKNNPDGIRKANGARKLWKTGTDDDFVEGTQWFTHAYFSFPEDIDPLITDAGLTPVHLAGVEGIFGENMGLFHSLDEELKQQWMDFIIEHCEDIHMVHSSKHLLSVSQNKS